MTRRVDRAAFANVSKALERGAWVATKEIERIHAKMTAPGRNSRAQLDDEDIARLINCMRMLAALKSDVRQAIDELQGGSVAELTDEQILEGLAKARGLRGRPRNKDGTLAPGPEVERVG